MADDKKTDAEGGVNIPDPAELSASFAKIAERSQRLVSGFLERQSSEDNHVGMADPMNVGNAFMELTQKMMNDPGRMIDAQINLWQDYMELWQSSSRAMMGEDSEPFIEPAKTDFRFKDETWQENALFDFIKQSYLLSARWLQDTVSETEGLDNRTKKKVDFYTKQFADAMAPTNFVMTNPEVLRMTLDTGGQNLVDGLENMLADLERGKGKLQISMTDTDAFDVGGNIAVTPGKVVYQNDLIQLLQYSPTTESVYKTPLLILPPWINKFYILDLRPKNSFIKWAVEQGLTVFVVSWVNPDEKLAAKTFEDYMIEGPYAALDAIEKATGEKDVNAIGYCLGGTLLAATLGHMTARNDTRIKSATFFTTMVDFADPGDLGVFIDEDQLASLEEMMDEKGYLEGSSMATTFNMLRANDLIWSFVINNYLKGKDPFPFDLLYWNSDSTRMPAAMHSFYLRKMYQDNLLCQPEGLEVAGTPIDLTKVKTPVFILSTREDHIAPWRSTYAATQLYSGDIEFVLAASGHIAGVVNPPDSGKYSHWTNDTLPADPGKWIETATEHPGTWWPHWIEWIGAKSGEKTKARTPGDGKLKVIEDAPDDLRAPPPWQSLSQIRASNSVPRMPMVAPAAVIFTPSGLFLLMSPESIRSPPLKRFINRLPEDSSRRYSLTVNTVFGRSDMRPPSSRSSTAKLAGPVLMMSPT